MPSLPLSQALTRNASKQCAYPGCHLFRWKLCKNCRKHAERKRKWGTPSGRTWAVKDVETYLEVSLDFVQSNRSHPGITSATKWLDAVLADATKRASASPIRSMATKVFGAFGERGITGKDLLVRVVATTIYLSELQPREQEQSTFIHNLGLFCLRALKPGIAKGKAQEILARELGGYLYAELRALLFSIIAHKQTQERQRAAFQKDARQPFHSV